MCFKTTDCVGTNKTVFWDAAPCFIDPSTDAAGNKFLQNVGGHQNTSPHFSQDSKLYDTSLITSNFIRLIEIFSACVEIRGSLSYFFRKITPFDHSPDRD